MEVDELVRKVSDLEKKVSDLEYDLRRAVDELDARIADKANKHHSHGLEGAA